MRKIYLDNIRWATVVLVVIYHVFYMFNAAGVPGGVGSFREVQYQDALLYFVYPWFMVLLFAVAGMSARYALEKISGKEFLRRRTWKLLVPSTAGLFVYQWIVGYFNIKIGGGLEYMPSFVVYPVSVLSGVGPLWFAQVLWLFSCVLLLAGRFVRNPGRKESVWYAEKKHIIFALVLCAVLLWGGAQILNMPVFTTYRFGIYLAAFLSGYFVLAHDKVQELLGKWCLPLLAVAVLLGIFYTGYYFGQNYADQQVLKSLFTNVYAWIMTLAVLGCGKSWFNRQNRFSRYMTGAGYGLYVLHYGAVLIPCCYLKNDTALPEGVIYILALLTVFIVTPVLYEIMRRIPFVRCLVLGIRKKDHAAAYPIKQED